MTAGGRLALFGKLPAHGDFVRRGDAGLARRLDDWLTGEVERLAMRDGASIDELLERMGAWCFMIEDGLVGGLAVSRDKVGRVFPLVAVRAGGDAAAVAASIRAAIDDPGLDADALRQELEHATAAPDAMPAAGWWRPSADPHVIPLPGLPVGPDFDRLLEGD